MDLGGKESRVRPLRIVFWIVGVLCSLGIISLFLPVSVLASVSAAVTIEPMPWEDPYFVFLLRTIFGMSAGIGAYHIIVAREIEKHGILIPFTGIAWIFGGAVYGIAGGVAQLPPSVFLGKTAFFLVIGVLILVFWGLWRPDEGQPAGVDKLGDEL